MTEKPPAPYLSAQPTLSDLSAIQALAKGEALPEQQVRALRYIIESLSEAYGLSYRPSQRDTDFAEGKRFVGMQLIRLTKLNPEALKQKDNNNVRRRHDTDARRDPDRSPTAEYGTGSITAPADIGTLWQF